MVPRYLSITTASIIAAALTSLNSKNALVEAKPLRHDTRRVAEARYINGTHYNDTSAVVLDVSVKNPAGRNNTSPLLYGWMFEDISVNIPLRLLCQVLLWRYLCAVVTLVLFSRMVVNNCFCLFSSFPSPSESILILVFLQHSGDGGIYAELIKNRGFQGAHIPAFLLFHFIPPVEDYLRITSSPLQRALA
jgi:hypothetical protein